MTASTEKAAKSEEYRDKDDNKCKNTAKFENIPKTDDSAGTKKDCFYWKNPPYGGFFCISAYPLFVFFSLPVPVSLPDKHLRTADQTAAPGNGFPSEYPHARKRFPGPPLCTPFH